jgi:GMP synthase (glutamine-hydrolysing)
MPKEVTVWHSHCDEIKTLPNGFHRSAWNETCQIQAMQDDRRPRFGVQFHPELFDDEHPEGRRILENFLGI